jgi:diguanylate cyclase (GGDEF)-like protein
MARDRHAAPPRPRVSPLQNPRVRIWGVVAGIACVATSLWFVVDTRLGPTTTLVPWWALTLAVVLCEWFPVHFEIKGEAHSVTLTEIPLVVGLLLATPVALLGSVLLGTNIARLTLRRQSPIKHAFNIAVSGLDVTLSLALFSGFASGLTFGPLVWVATLGVTLCTTVCTAALVACVIVLAQPGERVSLKGMLTPAMFVTVANTSLALGVVALLRVQRADVVLLASPAIALVLAYRAYASERRERHRVDFLFRSTSSFLSSRDAQLGMEHLLQQAREGFATERAEVVLFGTGDAPLRIHVDVYATSKPLSADEATALRAFVRDESKAILVDKVAAGSPIGDYLSRRGYRDAMVQTLPGDDAPLGVLLVGDRRGEVDRFTHEDLRLFAALAQQTAVVLHSDQLRTMLTDLQELQSELAYHADHDDLTGLANRRLFAAEVEAAVARSAQRNDVAVMFLDLDDFKRINDSIGHVGGDELLRIVSERIRHGIRPQDLPARLGGDEFAVLLRGVETPDDAYVVAQRVLDALRAPFAINNEAHTVRASIGLAVKDADTRDSVELLRDADVAMYEAKAAGKGRAVLFAADMRAAALSRHALLSDLERALDAGELEVAFQPIVSLTTGCVISLEALARWNHPRLGWVPPAKFVPLAEAAGLVGEIGRFVLDASCGHLARWRQGGIARDVTISVNVSALEFGNTEFVDEVLGCITRHGLAPSDVVLEITESVQVEPTGEIPPQLARLCEAGIPLAMDDFGTGYASLSLLRWLPVDLLKIDRSFVSELDERTTEHLFTRAIAELAQGLGLAVVAEGIETVEQLNGARTLGCDLGQGFHFSRPVRPEAVPELVRRGFSIDPLLRIA